MDFKEWGINNQLVKALEHTGYHAPTSIQLNAWKANQLNFIAQSKNGTGKTLAFLIILIHKLYNTDNTALIFTPTREIALQIKAVFQSISQFLKPQLRILCAVGGFSIHKDIEVIDKYNPNIIVGTLGRIRALIQKNSIDESKIKMIVLDEADILVRESCFMKDITHILSAVNISMCQLMAFSATVTEELEKFFIDKGITHTVINESKESNNEISSDTKWDMIFLRDVWQFYTMIKDNDSYNQKLTKVVDILNNCQYNQAILFYNNKLLGTTLERDLV